MPSSTFSLITLLFNVIVTIYNIYSSSQNFKFKQLEVCYNQKLECYTKIVSHFSVSHPDETSDRNEFLVLLAQAQLLSSNRDTTNKIVALSAARKYGVFSEEYAKAYRSCIHAMKKELNLPTLKTNYNNKK